MRNVPVKANGDPFTPDDFNPNQEENENVVLSTGQTLDSGNNYQLSISTAIYSACGDFYTDGGTVNNIILSPIGLMKYPTSYKNGMRIRFLPANNNTSSCNITVGTLGSIPLYRSTSIGYASIVAGDLNVYYYAEAIYNIGENKFILLNPLTESSGFTTGDRKETYKTSADAGWVMMNDGTIGDALSGGSTLADPSAEALFVLLWNNCADAQCPVSSGRGASALNDWNAHKNIRLPQILGRSSSASGSGSGLTPRILAEAVGVENVTLDISTIPAHSHNKQLWTVNRAADTIPCLAPQSSATPYMFTTDNTGGGGAHNNMQPSEFSNRMIKL